MLLVRRMGSFARIVLLLGLISATYESVEADNLLFIGNSFTFGASVPRLPEEGGVPKLVEQIARAKGHTVSTRAVTAPGRSWSYHLAQPATAAALAAQAWTWVVLQDFSTRPTRIGDVPQFMRDGETFSDRIAETSPHAGILLFETWARPPGAFYQDAPGNRFASPAEMMSDLHRSYGQLRDDLLARNTTRPVRVAMVGTAFARCEAEFPAIPLDAADHHHTTQEGYYLAALVIEETLEHESVRDAPATFFQGRLVIPAGEAAKLQIVADEVARSE